jgi:hypothetical protein
VKTTVLAFAVMLLAAMLVAAYAVGVLNGLATALPLRDVDIDEPDTEA